MHTARDNATGLTRRRLLLLLAAGVAGVVSGRAPARSLALGFDREGHAVEMLADVHTRIVVTLFVATDCPISNRYMPEILRLSQEFTPRGARFWLVYPNPADDVEAVRAHQSSFTQAAMLDTLIAAQPGFVRRAGVIVTPEAALFRVPFDDGGASIWHGPIDDRYPAIGQQRAAPTRHDLAVALEAALQGQVPAPAVSHPVGCAIISGAGYPGRGAGRSGDHGNNDGDISKPCDVSQA